MHFFRQLANRRRITHTLKIINQGRILNFSFHPTRRGRLRIALATDVLEVNWYGRSVLKTIRLNQTPVTTDEPDMQIELMSGILKRSDFELQAHRRSIKDHVLFLDIADREGRNCKLSRIIQVLAYDHGAIFDLRNPQGYGSIRMRIQDIEIDAHFIEGDLCPAITINKMAMFSEVSDVKCVCDALISRLRRDISRNAILDYDPVRQAA